MIGVPTSMLVRVSRKLSDSEYGSYEVAAELTVNLAADSNIEEAFNALDSWLSAAVGASMVEKKANIQQMRGEARAVAKSASVAQDAQHPPIAQQEEPKADAKEGEEVTFLCVKFTLAKQPDKKFRLELYPQIKDAPGKYHTIRFTAEREAMWEMLHDVAAGFDFSDLPVEYKCEWLVHYAIGREFEIKAGEHKGEKSHYKDLLAIKGS